MRTFFRSLAVVFLATLCWAEAAAIVLASAVCDVSARLAGIIREALTWSFDTLPQRFTQLQPMRRITMAATALNDRLVGGVRIHGFLGRPAVRMLAG